MDIANKSIKGVLANIDTTIQGKPVNITGITDGQVLKYEAAGDRFIPADMESGGGVSFEGVKDVLFENIGYTSAPIPWQCPTGLYKIKVVVIGGGGGANGGGGGGGGVAIHNNVTVSPGTIYNIVAGVSGLGYDTHTPQAATSGGNSSAFGITAYGGAAGSATGGAGGSATGGELNMTGGTGADAIGTLTGGSGATGGGGGSGGGNGGTGTPMGGGGGGGLGPGLVVGQGGVGGYITAAPGQPGDGLTVSGGFGGRNGGGGGGASLGSYLATSSNGSGGCGAVKIRLDETKPDLTTSDSIITNTY